MKTYQVNAIDVHPQTTDITTRPASNTERCIHWAPTATPNDILVKLNAEVQRILSDAAFRDQFLGPNFYEPITGTPEQFATYIQSEATKWSKLIKEANIKTE